MVARRLADLGLAGFGGKTVGFFTTFYAGAIALIAVVSAWKWRLPGARFARVLFLVSLAAAVLPTLLPDEWLGLPSPIPLRFPEKFAVDFALALAILSGLALDRFRERPSVAPRGFSSSAGYSSY